MNKEDLIQYIMEEQEFYEKVKKFLSEKMNCKLDSDPIIYDGGHLGVLMKGEFAGYSLWSLMDFVARKEGKKLERDPEDIY